MLGVNRTPCSAPCGCSVRRASWSSAVDEVSRSPVHPNEAPSSHGARELVSFARQQGYRLDELVKIIEDVGLKRFSSA